MLQSVWYFLSHLFYHGVNLVLIGQILSGNQCDACYAQIQLNAGFIFIYNLSILIFAGLSGFVGKQIVRKQKWDRKYKYFRFQNVWHYILTGEFFDFPRASFTISDKVSAIEMVFVDALVETQEGTLLYNGILVDYELNNMN